MEIKAIIEKAAFQIVLSNPEQQVLPNLTLPETTKLLFSLWFSIFFFNLKIWNNSSKAGSQ